MQYQVYATSKPSTFIITVNAEGAQSAEAEQGRELGSLKLWKTLDSLEGAIGCDPTDVVDANIARQGFHVQSTKVTFTGTAI